VAPFVLIGKPTIKDGVSVNLVRKLSFKQVTELEHNEHR
jgi:hypothetical protein